MPTRNVSLTPELDAYVTSLVKKGRFENASMVMRVALKVLRNEDQLHSEWLQRIAAGTTELFEEEGPPPPSAEELASDEWRAGVAAVVNFMNGNGVPIPKGLAALGFKGPQLDKQGKKPTKPRNSKK